MRSCSTILTITLLSNVVAIATAQTNSNLFVVGGFPTTLNDTDDVELVDLSGGGKACAKPAKYPFITEGGFAIVTPEGDPVVCGGLKDAWTVVDICHKYNAANDYWERMPGYLAMPRAWGAAATLPDGRVWVTGGATKWLSQTSTTEMVTVTSTRVTTVVDGAAPDGLSAMLHCAVALNASHVLLAGGWAGSNQTSSRTYIVELGQPHVWTRVQDLPMPMVALSCGLVNGVDIVAVGNYTPFDVTTTHIFSLQTLSWRVGPPLTVGLAATVVLGDSFLLVGGSGVNLIERHDKILEFDGATMAWKERPERLAMARDTTLVFLVPDTKVACKSSATPMAAVSSSMMMFWIGAAVWHLLG